MTDIGYAVRPSHDPPLERGGLQAAFVAPNTVEHLPGDVETATVLLDDLENADALLVMTKEGFSLSGVGLDAPIAGDGARECALPLMAEGRVAEVVPQGDGLSQVLVEAKRTGDGARNLSDLEGVGEARPIVVAFGGEKDLRLVGEAPEALAVENPVPVALVARPQQVLLLGDEPSPRFRGSRGARREELLLATHLVLTRQNPHGHHLTASLRANLTERGGTRRSLP